MKRKRVFYTFRRTMGELGLDEDQLHSLISEGTLRAFRDDDTIKFLKDDVEKRGRKLKVARKVRRAAPPGSDGAGSPSGQPVQTLEDSGVVEATVAPGSQLVGSPDFEPDDPDEPDDFDDLLAESQVVGVEGEILPRPRPEERIRRYFPEQGKQREEAEAEAAEAPAGQIAVPRSAGKTGRTPRERSAGSGRDEQVREVSAAKKAAVAILFALLFCVVLYFNMAPSKEVLPAVRAGKVVVKDVVLTVRAGGRTLPGDERLVRAPWAGRVAEILVEREQSVRRLERVVVLVSDDLDEELKSATASRDRATKQLDELLIKLANSRQNLEWKKRELEVDKEGLTMKVAKAESQVRIAENRAKEVQLQIDELAKEIARDQRLSTDPELRLEWPAYRKKVKEGKERLEKLKLQLASAEEKAKQARQDISSMRLELKKLGELHRFEGAVRISEAQVETARVRIREEDARIAQTRARLLKGSVSSPIPGEVTEIFVRRDQQVASGEKLVQVSDLRNLVVEARVEENDFLKVKRGHEAFLQFEALGRSAGTSARLAGKVVEVSMKGVKEAGSEVSVFPTRIRLEGTTAGLRPGMSAQVEIAVERARDALAVPHNAVLERQGKGKGAKAVLILEPDGKAWKVRRVEVATGLADDDHVAVQGSLTAGTMVVVGPTRVVRSLEAGQRVRVAES